MTDANTKAAEYRCQAARCIDVAERMSLISDRERMLKMADDWLALAREAEEKMAT